VYEYGVTGVVTVDDDDGRTVFPGADDDEGPGPNPISLNKGRLCSCARPGRSDELCDSRSISSSYLTVVLNRRGMMLLIVVDPSILEGLVMFAEVGMVVKGRQVSMRGEGRHGKRACCGLYKCRSRSLE
jgi:hypothetical protein